jgi:hypothetical protein
MGMLQYVQDGRGAGTEGNISEHDEKNPTNQLGLGALNRTAI